MGVFRVKESHELVCLKREILPMPVVPAEFEGRPLEEVFSQRVLGRVAFQDIEVCDGIAYPLPVEVPGEQEAE